MQSDRVGILEQSQVTETMPRDKQEILMNCLSWHHYQAIMGDPKHAYCLQQALRRVRALKEVLQ